MRIIKNFNRDWLFMYGNIENAGEINYDDSNFTHIGLPHSFSANYDLNENSNYIGYGWYRKKYTMPFEWNEKIVNLEFNGVFQVAEIYINGEYVTNDKVYGYEDTTKYETACKRDFKGNILLDKNNVTELNYKLDQNGNKIIAPTHKGGYAGFSVNITEYVKFGEENVIDIKVNNFWQGDLAPRSGDHQFSGGIYRDVILTVTNKLHIDWYGTQIWTPSLTQPCFQKREQKKSFQETAYGDKDFFRNGTGITNTFDDKKAYHSKYLTQTYVTEEELLSNIKNRRANIEIETDITNYCGQVKKLIVKHEVYDKQNNQFITEFFSNFVTLEKNERKTISAESEIIENIKLWDFFNPNLYYVITKVYADNSVVDEYISEFGFRSSQFKLDGFYLNGNKTFLDGANVHQDHGGWCDAVTNQGFYRDVKYVKEAGMNFIRGSHYQHAPAFSKACDELGIGFWSETRMWGMAYADGTRISGTIKDWLRFAYPSEDKFRIFFEESCYNSVSGMIRMNRNHPSALVWSMGNETFTSKAGEPMQKMRQLVSNLRDMSHKLDPTRKAAMGGTQRENMNTLAVSDIAGQNGDGGTDEYTNYYLPHIVSEYGSKQSERGINDDGLYLYQSIQDPNNEQKFKLPSKMIKLYDENGNETGEEVLSDCAGLAVWCMYHHGSIGSKALRIMGLMDYYRLPLRYYYTYRADKNRCNGNRIPVVSMPEDVKVGVASQICIQASTDTMLDNKEYNDTNTVIANDGTSDVQIIVTMLNNDREWVDDNRHITLEVESGNGTFPTGKVYVFNSDTMKKGKASIEFRSYYSGETIIKAYIKEDTSVTPAYITVTSVNVSEELEGKEPADFNVNIKPELSVVLSEPETYGMNIAKNRQSRALSAYKGHESGKAIDGNCDTYWQAETPGNSSWWVFTENSYNVYDISINFGDKVYPFNLYYMPSGINVLESGEGEWVLVSSYNYETIKNRPYEEKLSGNLIGAVEIEFTGVPDDEYAKIYSLEAFGTVVSRYSNIGTNLSDLADKNDETVFLLNGNYSRFTSGVLLNDNISSTKLKIYATIDNKEILILENDIYSFQTNYKIDVSMQDVTKLRIVTDGNMKWDKPALWGAIREIGIDDSVCSIQISNFASHFSKGEEFISNIKINNKTRINQIYTAKMVLEDEKGLKTEISSKNVNIPRMDNGFMQLAALIPINMISEKLNITVFDLDNNLVSQKYIINSK